MRRVVLLTGLWAALAGTAEAACGTRGGPGFRSAAGKCVGWKELNRVCGVPPTLFCTPEVVADDADLAREGAARTPGVRGHPRELAPRRH